MWGMHELPAGIDGVADLPIVEEEFVIQELSSVLMADHYCYFLFLFFMILI